jgi:threonine aldolase
VKNVTPPDTNIIIFEIAGDLYSADIFKKLSEKGILVSIINKKIMRMVTHLNISSAMTEHVCKSLPGLV